jgi:FkbM family methyltransferase
VVAYEPDPAAVTELRRNLQLNAITNVEVREFALFDRDGELPFGGPTAGDNLGLSVSSLVYGVRAVTVRAVDAHREALTPEFEQASLLKIDIEGAEYRLLRSLHTYLRQRHPSLLLSLHGVRWRNTHLMPGHRWLNAAFRRLANAAERLPLLWRLRHYPYWYLCIGGRWRALPLTSRWRLLGLQDRELLLTCEAY